MTTNEVRRGLRRFEAGFTLLEMLVSIAIIGILIAISLPAVQSIRSTMRKADCSNRIRQQVLAVSVFADRHGHLPGNGGIGGPDAKPIEYPSKQGSLFVPSTTDLSDLRVYRWGLGDTNVGSREQTGSWAYAVLPGLELKAVQSNEDFEATLQVFHCPSRGRMMESESVDDDYGIYIDGGWSMSKTDYCMNGFLATVQPEVQTWSVVTDGLSQTIFVGEKAIDPSVHFGTSWYWDEPVWVGGSKGTARSGTKIFPDRIGIEFRDNWGSPHVGGAQFAYGDGSVRFIAFSVDSKVFKSAISPGGSHPIEVEDEGP